MKASKPSKTLLPYRPDLPSTYRDLHAFIAMGFTSNFDSREGTPIRVSIVECSTPWSEILLEEQSTTYFSPQSATGRRFSLASFMACKTRPHRLHKAVWFTVFLVIAAWLILNPTGEYMELERQSETELTTHNLEGLQFIAASHTFMRFVGRWTMMSNNLYIDGSFPGVYFDFSFSGSTTLLLSLHNKHHEPPQQSAESMATPPSLGFFPLANSTAAEPISLLVRIDDDEYIALHRIRVIAPMVRDDLVETLQVKGIYIDESGQLLPLDAVVSGSEDDASSESSPEGDDTQITSLTLKKMLEVVTDFPGSTAWRERYKTTSTTRDILGGVMGWEYLLGEMFDADHAAISTDAVDASRHADSAPNTAGGVPILIMRPFRGQLEEATHAVAERLQNDGDKAVFWLDTSGWLDTDVDFDGNPEDQDFFLDGSMLHVTW
ncbi:hypothetical protein G7Y89_g4999 [Cudoniella acicularis]|uniref:Transmembrane protein n=1 Tax=Cudoniella acicularis TaxID=354080 RepID=A0A8H4RRG0_9HELO|nr:hypothetical protein G7Y89_g4999 [Cudoniella acicularis]